MISSTRLFDIPNYQLETYPNPNMFVTKTKGEWTGISTKDFLNQTMDVARGLMAFGVQKGDNVALVSNNRYEWNIMDLAIQQVGAIVVPLSPSGKASCAHVPDTGSYHCKPTVVVIGARGLTTTLTATLVLPP